MNSTYNANQVVRSICTAAFGVWAVVLTTVGKISGACSPILSVARTKESFAILMAVDRPDLIGPEEEVWDEAILELGCSATVAGRAWVNEFIKKSNCDTKHYQTENKSFAGFTGEQVELRGAINVQCIFLGGYAKLLVHII